MNIIFGESLGQMPDKYTILELDQLRLPPEGKVVTTYCVVERVPLEEIPLIETYRQLHQDCITAYRQQRWEVCEQALESLQGRWNGELDSFYSHLSQRVSDFKTQPPASDWSGIIDKTQYS